MSGEKINHRDTEERRGSTEVRVSFLREQKGKENGRSSYLPRFAAGIFHLCATSSLLCVSVVHFFYAENGNGPHE